MKQVYTLVLSLITVAAFSQDVQLSPPFQATDFFINGITIQGTLITANASAADSVVYTFPDASTQTSTDKPNNFPVQYNLGLLTNASSINAAVWTGGTSQAATALAFPNAINKPGWLNFGSATTTVTSTAYPNIVIQTKLDIVNIFNAGGSQNDIPGISGKAISLSNCNLVFDITHDLSSNANSVVTPKVDFGVDVMGRFSSAYSVSVNSVAQIIITPTNFDLAVTVEDSITPVSFQFNFPAFRFAAGPVPIMIDGGVELSAQIKGKVYAGFSTPNNNWGFLDDGGTANTRLVAKLRGSGTLRVSAEVGLAGVSGSITLAGSLGGGLKYATFSNPQTEGLFGYTLSLAGTIGYRIGPPCFGPICLNKRGSLTKTFWENTSSGWANLRLPGQEPLFDNIDAKEIHDRDARANPSMSVPDFFAQPSFAQRDTNLVVMWLDYADSTTKLKLSYLNETGNTFGNEVVIHSSSSGITSPKVALLKDGGALMTWTQTRYGSDIDTAQVSLNNILESQDIYSATYNRSTNTVSAPVKIDDGVVSSDTSGRAEGNSKITLNSDSSGLITWTVGNLYTQVYSIWYATVNEANGVVTLGTPTQLSDAGASSDKNVRVAYTDGNNAIAAWIHDEDGVDSTLDQSIVYKKWNGSNWDNTQTTLRPSNPAKKIEELSLDFTGDYGALAFTSTLYDTARETFLKIIEADAWVSGNFTATPFEDIDSNYYFQSPRINVSNNGIATIIYQANAIYDDNDTTTAQKSYLYLLVKDLKDLSGTTWKEIDADGTIADSTSYAWDMDASFAGGENLLVISQEASNIDGFAPQYPTNGVRFGDNKLNLVLREVAFDNNLNVISAAEPTGSIISSVPTVTDNEQPTVNLYPNPATDQLFFNASGLPIEAINIYNLVGSLISQVKQPTTYSIDISSLNNGIYIAEIKTKDASVKKRWVKM